jgi:3-oxoacyl-[acyl-carrier protein] reductase
VALALDKEGAAVATISRTTFEPSKTRPDAASEHVECRIIPIVGDLSTEQGAIAAMDEAKSVLGGIDILINNAGASKVGAFATVADADWDEAIALKLMGYVRCIRSAVGDMTAQGWGRIINVAGIGGRLPSPNYVLGAVNAAILHLTSSLAQDFASFGVSVLAVNPGVTATPRVQKAISMSADVSGKTIEAAERDVMASIPARRFATPEEVANIITFLASDRCSYITGSSVQVDGGVSGGVF